VTIALLADVHANLQALEACLADAKARGAERGVFLGDLVNYGADPEKVLAIVRREVAGGWLAVLGNHDAAVGRRVHMDSPAELALEWTRVQLGAKDRDFLAGLPLTVAEADRLFVHADPAAPDRWAYMAGPEDAARGLRATEQRIVACGHVHVPAVYNVSAVGKLIAFRPMTDAPVPLLRNRRWLVVAGSVGQPRDGDSRASYALLDPERSEVTFHRVAYDVDAAVAKILDAGLPEIFAERLKAGR
jgi:diadenosine tetraphosphatase ApaH/serine/threonine PP2A family protein phosphatase